MFITEASQASQHSYNGTRRPYVASAEYSLFCAPASLSCGFGVTSGMNSATLPARPGPRLVDALAAELLVEIGRPPRRSARILRT